MTNIRETAVSTSEFNAPLPAGKYLVGDPCYSFTNDPNPNGSDLWMQWLNAAWKDCDANQVKVLDAEVAGFRIAASGTAYGDGQYPDQFGNSYCVDAGLIGAVPIEAISILYPEYAGLTDEALGEKTMTMVMTFDRPFHVSFDEDGVISVGHVNIETGDSDDDGCSYCGGYCDYEGECLEAEEEEETED